MPLSSRSVSSLYFLFFFNDTATPEIYTLSLHVALPISSSRESPRPWPAGPPVPPCRVARVNRVLTAEPLRLDRKSTRLNSSHEWISYAVFCLKKKNHYSQKRKREPCTYSNDT